MPRIPRAAGRRRRPVLPRRLGDPRPDRGRGFDVLSARPALTPVDQGSACLGRAIVGHGDGPDSAEVRPAVHIDAALCLTKRRCSNGTADGSAGRRRGERSHEDGPDASRPATDSAASLARREARNFYYAFLLLPATRRRSMCALYAFLRHTDDLADEPGSAADKARALDGWRHELDAALWRAVGTAWPGLPALADTVARHRDPRGAASRGDRRRLDGRRAAPVRDFRRSRGLLLPRRLGRRACCLHIWGYRSEGGKAERLAEACGIALQLTNILRDVREDARNGRIYLPEDDLARFGVKPDELSAGGRPSDRVRALAGLRGPARLRLLRAGRPLAPLVAPVGRPVLLTIVGIYRALLDEIVRRDYDVLDGRISVPPGERH